MIVTIAGLMISERAMLQKVQPAMMKMMTARRNSHEYV